MTGWLLDPLAHGFAVRAIVELVLIGAVSGAVGCWVVLYRVSYSAESLAHGMFPGLVAAALLGLPLLAGGAVGIIVAALAISVIARFTPGEADTAIAVVVTSLFGLGVLLALSPDTPPGIQALLFGDPLGVSDGDLVAAALLGTLVMLVMWRGHHRLLAAGFDRSFAGPGTLSPAVVQAVLLFLVAITVLVGVKGLGNLLVAAILVGPAAAARLLTDRMGPMMAVSVAVATVAGIGGIYLSYHAGIAAGGAVIVCLAALYALAAIASRFALRGRRRSDRASPGTGVRSPAATESAPTATGLSPAVTGSAPSATGLSPSVMDLPSGVPGRFSAGTVRSSDIDVLSSEWKGGRS